jgi:16S rRNA processing protein RimM
MSAAKNVSAEGSAATDIVVVGRIGSPYGVRGWMHVQSFTSPAENILNYQPWYIRKNERAPWAVVEDLQCRAHQKGFVAQFNGIDNRDDAATQTGALIGVAGECFPASRDPDEYYWRDLIGAQVVTNQGVVLGLVDDLMETGAHDVLVVAPTAVSNAGDDVDQSMILIPFVADYVVQVDLANAQVTVAWDPDW